MIVSLIVAMDRKRGIGKNNTLPWRLSDDLKLFKQRTMGHHIVFGRKTFDSIGRALPGRRTVIVSRNTMLTVAGCDVTSSLQAALDLAQSRGETECFICGGAELYAAALQQANKIYLSYVDAIVDADTFFPSIIESEWVESTREVLAQNEQNQYETTVVELIRRRAIY